MARCEETASVDRNAQSLVNLSVDPGQREKGIGNEITRWQQGQRKAGLFLAELKKNTQREAAGVRLQGCAPHGIVSKKVDFCGGADNARHEANATMASNGGTMT